MSTEETKEAADYCDVCSSAPCMGPTLCPQARSDLQHAAIDWKARAEAAEAQLAALDAEVKALHASAPAGMKCSDCTIDKSPCPDCYAANWKRQHPNTHCVGGVLDAQERANKAESELGRWKKWAAHLCENDHTPGDDARTRILGALEDGTRAKRELAALDAEARKPCGHACAECLKQECASDRPLPLPSSDGWTRYSSGYAQPYLDPSRCGYWPDQTKPPPENGGTFRLRHGNAFCILPRDHEGKHYSERGSYWTTADSIKRQSEDDDE